MSLISILTIVITTYVVVDCLVRALTIDIAPEVRRKVPFHTSRENLFESHRIRGRHRSSNGDRDSAEGEDKYS